MNRIMYGMTMIMISLKHNYMIRISNTNLFRMVSDFLIVNLVHLYAVVNLRFPSCLLDLGQRNKIVCGVNMIIISLKYIGMVRILYTKSLRANCWSD